MDRGNSGHDNGVIGKAAQVIRRQDLDLPAGARNRGIIACNACYIIAGHGRQGGQNVTQRAAPDLGPTAAAHRFVTQDLCDPLGHHFWQVRPCHFRQRPEFVHKFAVNMILPFPQKRALKGGPESFCNRVFLTQGNELEIILLRMIIAQGSTRQNSPQISGQNRRLSHGEYPRLGARIIGQMRTITDRKNRRVRGL